jgi:hypothetical protein
MIPTLRSANRTRIVNKTFDIYKNLEILEKLLILISPLRNFKIIKHFHQNQRYLRNSLHKLQIVSSESPFSKEKDRSQWSWRSWVKLTCPILHHSFPKHFQI